MQERCPALLALHALTNELLSRDRLPVPWYSGGERSGSCLKTNRKHRIVSAAGRDANATCNPIAQAEILNREQTELNYIVGLCMGHDILFTRYSEAPVSTLIVKDRMTGNNPAAALYGYHARKSLFKLPRMDKQKV